MSVSIVAAMTDDGVIGRNNQLPWHISEDLVRFKQLTMGHPIVMGRKTFESIGKPLPGRTNIVVTRNESLKIDGVKIVHSLKEGLVGEPFVIGGAALFAQALPLADKLYLTFIHHKITGDAYFPAFDLKRDFTIIEATHHQSALGERLSFSFVTATRKH